MGCNYTVFHKYYSKIEAMKTTIQFKQLADHGCRCRHMIQQDFAHIKGVYGLHSDMINNTVIIDHTEEVTYPQLVEYLKDMGYEVIKPHYYIRKATTEDIDALSMLAVDVIRNNYGTFLGESIVEAHINSGMVTKEIEDGLDTTILLTISEQEDQEENILAYAAHKGELIQTLMVRVGCQHQGIGTYLLQYIMNYLLKEYTTLRIEALANNIPAIRCYEKAGWRKSGIKETRDKQLTLLEMAYTSL